VFLIWIPASRAENRKGCLRPAVFGGAKGVGGSPSFFFLLYYISLSFIGWLWVGQELKNQSSTVFGGGTLELCWSGPTGMSGLFGHGCP